VQQEVVPALAKEPTNGCKLRARLRQALGPVGEGLNAGQLYLTLTQLEAPTADRLISARDGAFLDETRLIGGTIGSLGGLGTEA
jgi:hypothetical protein